MRAWLTSQYHDIKGNLKWALLAGLWWLAIHYGRKTLELIPNIPSWAVTLILLLVSLIIFVWLAKAWTGTHAAKQSVTSPMPASPQQSFPSISALHGLAPQVSFDVKEFFRTSYHSPLTAEVEQNIKIAAQAYAPSDPELFYSRFVGVGLVQWFHEMTWMLIFKSQLLMLTEINKRAGWLPVGDAKSFYDQAVPLYPKAYENYTFQNWLDFMKGQQLIIHHPIDASHPTEMLEITERGKDFLKFLAHWGRDINAKTC